MEIIRDQPSNIFGKHHTQTQSMWILTYLFMTIGILLSVWLILSRKTVKLVTCPTGPASQAGHGWSLDLTDKDL